MTKTTTIQISIYEWSIMEEIVYETQISSVGEFLALTYRFDKKIKYKKPTDKNWYYAKTMIKRLFKKELSSKSTIKFVKTNDLNKMYEEKEKAKEEARLKKEKEELEWEEWRKTHPDFTIEQIKSMSKVELANRLVNLYIEDYYIGKSDYNSYMGPFNCCLTEIAYVELQIPSDLADRAYYHAMEALCGGKLTYHPHRIPLSKTFRFTDDYELEYIGRA
ncbi:hypothetical protein [Halobacillus karajensis]|uniref:hypothetical protein n=1 Tax=Halobacillus karajensis TaxID=195088 RepID=UPI00045C7A33|nr:hypothetical protein [Halobacillus karajensis]CDQ21808.1 hypothetical protein BN982_04238 [Halobacillus karajensis]CDQ28934.1 hypothetical protein BN981_03252 [Halobacillus karajensis]